MSGLNTKATVKRTDYIIDANTNNNSANMMSGYVNTTNNVPTRGYKCLVIAATTDEAFAHTNGYQGHKLNEKISWESKIQTMETAVSSNLLRLFPLFSYDPRRYRYDVDNSPRESLMSVNHGLWIEPFARIVGGHNYVDTLKINIQDQSRVWTGFTMNSLLGFRPFDECCTYLPDFYNMCQNRDIPILAHCAPNGILAQDADKYQELDDKIDRKSKSQIRHKRMLDNNMSTTKDILCSSDFVGRESVNVGNASLDYFYKNYGHPNNWRIVLDYFPRLHLCLAGFGGNESWGSKSMEAWVSDYTKNEYIYKRYPTGKFTNLSVQGGWIHSIIKLTEEYTNVYTDISGLEIKNENIREALKLILKLAFGGNAHYKHLKNRLIFGSGFNMASALNANKNNHHKYCDDLEKLCHDVEDYIKRRGGQLEYGIWEQITIINPWQCYSMSEQMFDDMCAALRNVNYESEERDNLIELDRNILGALAHGNTPRDMFIKMKAALRKITANNFNEASILAAEVMLTCANDDIEYAATICKRTVNGSDTFFVMNAAFGDEFQIKFRNGIGHGVETMAYIHTHGRSGKETFSAADLLVALDSGKAICLVTNRGKLLRSTEFNRINDFIQPYDLVNYSNTPDDKIRYINDLYRIIEIGPVEEKDNAEDLLFKYLQDNLWELYT